MNEIFYGVKIKFFTYFILVLLNCSNNKFQQGNDTVINIINIWYYYNIITKIIIKILLPLYFICTVSK